MLEVRGSKALRQTPAEQASRPSVFSYTVNSEGSLPDLWIVWYLAHPGLPRVAQPHTQIQPKLLPQTVTPFLGLLTISLFFVPLQPRQIISPTLPCSFVPS